VDHVATDLPEELAGGFQPGVSGAAASSTTASLADVWS
jgi:hypothetical protein